MTRVRRPLAWLAGALLLIAAAGAAYNAGSLAYYRHRAGVPGKLYTVNGAPMHIYCTGQGAPAIVLETGLGDDFTIWAKVQPALAKITRVCSYDRSGWGWSPARAGVRDADTIAAELHQLLAAAGVQAPFVLMGHSIAGLYLRSYAAHYPAQLAGMVLVDAATPLQNDRLPPALIKIQDAQRSELPYQQVLMALGWYRMRGMCTDVQPGMEGYSAWIKADSCVPSQMSTMATELDALPVSGQETIHAGPYGQLPLLIFSRDPASVPSNWPADLAHANAVVWEQMQEESKALSHNSRRIVARRSDHYVHIDRPELVIDEVTKFVGAIRAGNGAVQAAQTVVR